MNIFVINSGSSSIKYQLFKMPYTEPICTGLVDRIGIAGASITHKTYLNGQEAVHQFQLEIPDHATGLNAVNDLLINPEFGVISSTDEIKVVGHRVVHGGDFSSSTIITPEVKAQLKETFKLAPLHNPPSYTGIEVAEQIFQDAKQIAVFDTAFHQTMPDFAYRFAIPNEIYKSYNVRSYGFHGTSHKYVSKKANEYLGSINTKLISIHLGNGCSITAVQNGKSIDTSMGFGPLSGLIMGTRSGDIDSTVVFYLVNTLGFNIDKVSNLLNKQSGMLGLTGYSDMRDITKAIAEGDENAKLAYAMYAYRIKKYIGAYAAAMNGVDAILFTAGVGENDALVREMVCKDLDYLGVKLDVGTNNIRKSGIREINTSDSKVKVLVVPTNEELEIASECYQLVD